MHQVPYFLQLGDTYNAPLLRKFCLDTLFAKYDEIEGEIRAQSPDAGGIEQQLESDELRGEVQAIRREKSQKRVELVERFEDQDERTYNTFSLLHNNESYRPFLRATAVVGAMAGVAAVWAFLP